MNAERDILVKRLLEAGFDSRRFLKVDVEKKAFETNFQDRLYTPEELDQQGVTRYGICGKDGLVLIDTDKREMADIIEKILPPTFQASSPRRKLPHFYFAVEGDDVPNKTLHLPNDEDGSGEIRALNEYLVAPGTVIRFKDLETEQETTGTYKVLKDRPIAKMCTTDFLKAIEPYLGSDKRQPITFEQMRDGVPQGIRHAQGIKYACFLIGIQKFDAATALSEMKRWNTKNRPPMEEADLERMVANALGYVQTSEGKEVFHIKTDLPEKEDKEKSKRQIVKDSGLLDNGCFESVYVDGKPFFLVKNSENFKVMESLEIDGETVCPKEEKHIPYEPYGVFQGNVPDREALYWKVRNEFDLFIDVESIWKDVLAACTLLTYHQEKLQTTPYLFLYGDNESGKSTILQILNCLAYRPMFGVTVPSADLYGYLETSDSIGCILEDEIQGIHKDLDKTKIYKSGYKQGAVVPRTILTQFERLIKYFRTFCFKACASEQISPIKGFNERFLFIPMVEGTPQKEWADISKEDLARLRELRSMLLKWRMLSRNWDLPEVKLIVKGRLKELWKPILQITSGLTAFDGLFKFVEDQRTERVSTKQNTLEGHIVKTVVDLFNESKEPLDYIPFQTIWNELRFDLDGKIDDRKPHVMDTSEFFEVSKNKIGYRLREVLSGKSKPVREKDSEGKDVIVKAYVFDQVKLRRIARKYGFEFVTKLPSVPSSEGVKPLERLGSDREMNVKDHAEGDPKQAYTPQELGKLSNLVTEPSKSENLVTEQDKNHALVKGACDVLNGPPEPTSEISEVERTCGKCLLWHKPGCTFPDAEYSCVAPTNRHAIDCRDFMGKTGNHALARGAAKILNGES